MFAHSIYISIFEVPNLITKNQNFLRFNISPLRFVVCTSMVIGFGDSHKFAGVFSFDNVLINIKMPNPKKNVLNANNSSIVDNSEILTYEFANTLKMLSLCIEDKAYALLCCLANKKELEKNLFQIIALSRSINKSIDADEFQDLGDILTTLSNHYQNQI